MGSLLIKNDQTTNNAPSPSQIAVGEIAINAVTGRLYIKLTNGTVVEFIGRQVCFSKTPAITFDDVSNFCCAGDILSVKVIDLLVGADYAFELEDISGNGVSYTINSPVYTEYSYTPESSTTTVQLKEAIIPITINITGTKNLTILKFKIMGKGGDINLELTSRIVSISCQNC
jgi:hypothetical protein